jgi:hypothetical protein
MPPAADKHDWTAAKAEQMTFRVRDELGIIMIAFRWVVKPVLATYMTSDTSE